MLSDTLITAFDRTLRVISGVSVAHRPYPALSIAATSLSDADRRHSAGLMRVNHVGEVCAQALYTAQALATRNPGLRAHYEAACAEEVDHLAWCNQRLKELYAQGAVLTIGV